MKFTALFSILAISIFVAPAQASAHDLLPDMKNGVWLMDSSETDFLEEGDKTTTQINQNFNIDYFLGSKLTCADGNCYVEKSAMSCNGSCTVYPAAGTYSGNTITLKTDVGDEILTQTYTIISEKLVSLSWNGVNKSTGKMRFKAEYTFKKVL